MSVRFKKKITVPYLTHMSSGLDDTHKTSRIHNVHLPNAQLQNVQNTKSQRHKMSSFL
jgi:hypothetical protein